MDRYNEYDLISVDVATLEEKAPGEFFNEKSVVIVPIIKRGVLELKNSNVEEDDILSNFDELYNSDRTLFRKVFKNAWKLKEEELTERINNQSYQHRIIRLFFDTEIEGEKVTFSLSQVTSIPIYKEAVLSSGIKEYEHRWDYTASVVSSLRIINGEYTANLIEFNDATTTIYQKQKRNDAEIKRYMDRLLAGEQLDAYGIETFFKVMGYLNFIMEHPEFKEVGEHKKRSRANDRKKLSEPMQTKHEEKPKMREVSLNGILMRTSNPKVANTMRSRQIHRVATCWGVRGHFRHYKKSGKVVYIEPYEKGKDVGSRIKKIYKL